MSCPAGIASRGPSPTPPAALPPPAPAAPSTAFAAPGGPSRPVGAEVHFRSREERHPPRLIPLRRLAHHRHSLEDRLAPVVVHTWLHVGCGHHHLDSIAPRHAQELEGLLDLLRPVVDAREKV